MSDEPERGTPERQAWLRARTCCQSEPDPGGFSKALFKGHEGPCLGGNAVCGITCDTRRPCVLEAGHKRACADAAECMTWIDLG